MNNVMRMLMGFILSVGLIACEGNPNIGKLLSQQNAIGCTDALATNYNANAKTDDCSCNYNFSSTIGNAPPQFTQKALIEKFTGAWCGWCPDGSDVVKTIEQANSNKIVTVEVHQGDAMEVTPVYNYYANLFAGVGAFPFPSALINRTPSIQANQQLMENRAHWSANADAILAKTPSLGLALETKPLDGSPTLENIMVKVAFNQNPTEEMQLVVYLIENNIVARQYRYQVGGSGGYINDYTHQKVLRKALTGAEGITIPACGAKANTTFSRMFRVDLGGYVRSNCEIIAFVMNKTASVNNLRVLNAQKVKLGEVKNWD